MSLIEPSPRASWRAREVRGDLLGRLARTADAIGNPHAVVGAVPRRRYPRGAPAGSAATRSRCPSSYCGIDDGHRTTAACSAASGSGTTAARCRAQASISSSSSASRMSSSPDGPDVAARHRARAERRDRATCCSPRCRRSSAPSPAAPRSPIPSWTARLRALAVDHQDHAGRRVRDPVELVRRPGSRARQEPGGDGRRGREHDGVGRRGARRRRPRRASRRRPPRPPPRACSFAPVRRADRPAPRSAGRRRPGGARTSAAAARRGGRRATPPASRGSGSPATAPTRSSSGKVARTESRSTSPANSPARSGPTARSVTSSPRRRRSSEPSVSSSSSFRLP